MKRALAVVLGAVAVAGCATSRPSQKALDALAAGQMVEVAGGTVQLGGRTNAAIDIVSYERLKPFLLDVGEVTVAAYGRCAEAGACEPAGAKEVDPADRARGAAACNVNRADRADHPVNCVDWEQAKRYCAWAGKRLPSEAEWEWAARNAGAATPFPWGNDAPGPQPCWSGEGNDAGAPRTSTCASGSHPADVTSAGVKDLGGDVWEWTASAQQIGADSRGRGGSTGRVARGAAWSERDPDDLFVVRRIALLPGVRDARLGFRCASDR